MTVRKGLVLEGGAMRGMFTNGVTDVMMENGITYDGLVGVSAGAAFGCNYKSNQPGRAIRYNTDYCSDPRYCSIRSLIKTGDIYGADFCYREIPDELDIFDWEAFEKNPMEFHVSPQMWIQERPFTSSVTIEKAASTGSGLPHPCPWSPESPNWMVIVSWTAVWWIPSPFVMPKVWALKRMLWF